MEEKYTSITIQETSRFKGQCHNFIIAEINTTFAGVGINSFTNWNDFSCDFYYGEYPKRPIEYCKEFWGYDEDLKIDDRF